MPLRLTLKVNHSVYSNNDLCERTLHEMRPCLGSNHLTLASIYRVWMIQKNHNTQTYTHHVHHKEFHRRDYHHPRVHSQFHFREDLSLRADHGRFWTFRKYCATLHAGIQWLPHSTPHHYGCRRRACCKLFLIPKQGTHECGKILNHSHRIPLAGIGHGWYALHLSSPDF